MIKIAVDAFGGDRSPEANVQGALLALENIADLEIVLVGDEAKLKSQLENQKYDAARLSILHAPDVISCEDKPTVAIKTMKESSMVKAFDLMKQDESVVGLVTCGSTGALLAGAVLKCGRVRGVKRPAFCPIMPTMDGNVVGICDSGANVDCDPVWLQQFAVMASLYLNKAFGIEKPRVALLNVGVEEGKGDARSIATYQLLKNQTPQINFVGNMESRDALSGNYDLIVCDGFSGNVLVKSTEGACLEVMKMLKGVMTKNFKNKMGALLLKKDVMGIKNKMDYNNYPGAVLLGAAKTIVKSHGSSKHTAVYKSIEQAYKMEKANIRGAIAEEMAKLVPADQQ